MIIGPLDSSFAYPAAQLHKISFHPSWSESEFKSHIERPTDHIIGAYEGQTLYGFILCRSALEQAEILTFIIAPDQRRQGLGAALLERVEQDLKRSGVDLVFLDVAEDNLAAQHLYKKSGYYIYAKRPGYYRRIKAGKTIRIGANLLQKAL